MKLTLRLIHERPNHRRFRRVAQRRSRPFIFERQKSNFYEYTVEKDDPKAFQSEVDEIFQACHTNNLPATIVASESILSASPLRAIDTYPTPDYAGLGEPQLRELCTNLGIPNNDRHSAGGLREKLELYHKAQCDLIQSYQLPDSAKPIRPPEPDLEEAHAEAKQATEIDTPKMVVEKLPANATREDVIEYVAAFADKELLVAQVKEETGESIDRRCGLETARKKAVDALDRHLVEQRASAKQGD